MLRVDRERPGEASVRGRRARGQRRRIEQAGVDHAPMPTAVHALSDATVAADVDDARIDRIDRE